MTSAEVARRLIYTVSLISLWERGARKPRWDELYAILPELPEIRKKGCAAYCPKAAWCKKDGHCLIARGAKSKGYLQPDFVNVVRCKDCKQWRRNIGFTDSPNGHCFYIDMDTNQNHFCSYGERRKTDE